MTAPHTVAKDDLLDAALQHFTGAQHRSASELRRVQDTKIRMLLPHATENVRLYRELYRGRGIQPDEIRTAEDLWRLPSVSKEDYQRIGPQGYVDERHKIETLAARTTSGSLGSKLAVYTSQEEAVRARASLWSGWLARGVTTGDRLLMIGSTHLERGFPGYRSDFVPAHAIDDEVRERFRRFQPTVIVGIVECVAMLAQDVKRRELRERRGVRMIFVFGQALSPQLKQLIESGFDAEIFDLYGATETSWMGYECERHAGLHLNLERCVVQLARLDNPDQPVAPGELGQVIVTSLMRRITPFIRYRMNDVAALDETPCPCGRSSPRLRAVEGRVHDFLIAAGGQWIPPARIFVNLGPGSTLIADVRVVQETREHVRVSAIPAAGFDDAERERIKEVIRHQLGDVAVTIDLVEEIPLDPSGKRRRIFRAFDLPPN